MLEKVIEILTEVKDELLDYQNEEMIELNNVIDEIEKHILEEKNVKSFIIKSFSENDSYYIIPESLEEKFDEFKERLESLFKNHSSNYVTYNKKQNIYREFDAIFDEYSYENLSNIKIKGVIERE